jgi:sirohydrochlorin cobaltochelatase
MTRNALVLFAHGARDPRWAAPFQKLQKITQEQLPDTVVSLAFLELMMPSLPDLVAQLVQDGCANVTIVPVFLGQGGHLLRDLPVIIAQLQEAYQQLVLKVAQAVGEDVAVLNAISQYCVSYQSGQAEAQA